MGSINSLFDAGQCALELVNERDFYLQTKEHLEALENKLDEYIYDNLRKHIRANISRFTDFRVKPSDPDLVDEVINQVLDHYDVQSTWKEHLINIVIDKLKDDFELWYRPHMPTNRKFFDIHIWREVRRKLNILDVMSKSTIDEMYNEWLIIIKEMGSIPIDDNKTTNTLDLIYREITINYQDRDLNDKDTVLYLINYVADGFDYNLNQTDIDLLMSAITAKAKSQQENTMSKSIKVTTEHFINGTNIKDVDDDQIITYIAETEAQIVRLENIETNSKTITAKVKEHKDAIASMVKLLDNRNK